MYVLRNEDGKIVGAFELPQVGMSLEFIDIADEELQTFIGSTTP